LAAYAGRRPIDLFSGDELPVVEPSSYRLRLDGYGYRWLKLV
jgi:hypothetical protein